MRSLLMLSSIATLAHANGLLQPSPVCATQDPTITPAPQVPMELLRRQNNNRFMGWISYEDGWTTRQCEIGGTLYQSGDFWRCCATTIASCNGPVGCISGSLIYSFSTGSVTRGTYACTSVYTDPEDSSFTLCNTGFMFENSMDSSPQTNIFCGISAVNWSYYRVKPAEAESTTTSELPSSASSTPASTSSEPTSGPSLTTGIPVPQEPAEKKEKSKAWIAGAVVGPVVGLALIGLLAWIFLVKKKKNKKTAAAAGGVGPAPSTAPTSGPPSSYPGSPQQGFYQPMQQTQQNTSGFVPYGVGVQEHYGANDNKHQSWAQQPPHSPLSHGSQSPNMQQGAPFAQPPPQQQQYAYPQPGQPQMMSPQPSGSPPPHSPQPQYGAPAPQGQSYPNVGEPQYANELAGSSPNQAVPIQQQPPK